MAAMDGTVGTGVAIIIMGGVAGVGEDWVGAALVSASDGAIPIMDMDTIHITATATTVPITATIAPTTVTTVTIGHTPTTTATIVPTVTTVIADGIVCDITGNHLQRRVVRTRERRFQ
jgi:hypothetical protein